MNKRGQEGVSGLGVVIAVIVGVAVLAVILSVIFSSKGTVETVNNVNVKDLTAISAACTGAIQLGESLGYPSYCREFRDYRVEGGLLTVFKKDVRKMNCNYAFATKKYIKIDTAGKAEIPCYGSEARDYCEDLNAEQGTNFNGKLLINGETCDSLIGVAAPPTPPTPPVATTASWTGEITKTCVEQGGETKPIGTACPADKPVIHDSGFSGSTSDICCTA